MIYIISDQHNGDSPAGDAVIRVELWDSSSDFRNRGWWAIFTLNDSMVNNPVFFWCFLAELILKHLEKFILLLLCKRLCER